MSAAVFTVVRLVSALISALHTPLGLTLTFILKHQMGGAEYMFKRRDLLIRSALQSIHPLLYPLWLPVCEGTELRYSGG